MLTFIVVFYIYCLSLYYFHYNFLLIVFSPLETLIAVERLSKQLTELNHNVKVKIMTLYGDMPVEDRVEVFGPLESGYHHKVIGRYKLFKFV